MFVQFTPQINQNKNLCGRNFQAPLIYREACDSFSKSGSKIAFGGIKHKEFSKFCHDLLTQTKKANTPEKVMEIAEKFYSKNCNKIMLPEVGASKDELRMFGVFSHELMPSISRIMLTAFGGTSPQSSTSAIRLISLKNEVEIAVSELKDASIRWKTLEKWWGKTDLEVPFNEVYSEIRKILSSRPHGKFSINGLELVQGKSVKDPAQFYNLFSQPLMNSIKYGWGKPFKVQIKEVEKAGKKEYYAYFTNPKTKPISNEDIDKLIIGHHHRDKNALESGIPGTGVGISEIVKILKEQGREKDIQNLFQRNRKQGVCVRIPLLGIQ